MRINVACLKKLVASLRKRHYWVRPWDDEIIQGWAILVRGCWVLWRTCCGLDRIHVVRDEMPFDRRRFIADMLWDTRDGAQGFTRMVVEKVGGANGVKPLERRKEEKTDIECL